MPFKDGYREVLGFLILDAAYVSKVSFPAAFPSKCIIVIGVLGAVCTRYGEPSSTDYAGTWRKCLLVFEYAKQWQWRLLLHAQDSWDLKHCLRR